VKKIRFWPKIQDVTVPNIKKSIRSIIVISADRQAGSLLHILTNLPPNLNAECSMERNLGEIGPKLELSPRRFSRRFA
jgi:hypothetical protein